MGLQILEHSPPLRIGLSAQVKPQLHVGPDDLGLRLREFEETAPRFREVGLGGPDRACSLLRLLGRGLLRRRRGRVHILLNLLPN